MALAFSALSLVFAWYAFDRDRYKFRVVSSFNFNPERGWGSQAFLRVTVRNNSKKAITVNKLGIVTAGKTCAERFFDDQRKAPLQIEGGEEVSTVVENNDGSSSLPENTDLSRCKVYVTDALRRMHAATYINESNYF